MKHLKGTLLIDQTLCIGREISEAWRSISESPVSFLWREVQADFSASNLVPRLQSAAFQPTACLWDGPSPEPGTHSWESQPQPGDVPAVL